MKLTKYEREAFEKGLTLVFGEGAKSFAEFDAVLAEKAFSNGETIFENMNSLSALGFFVRGGADIVRAREGCEVYIRSMKSGDVFGAATLFSDTKEYVTRIRAKGETKVLFLPSNNAEAFMIKYPQAALGYISFLTEKIRFLNRKIATFTAGSAIARVAGFILANYSEEGFKVSLSYSKVAESLGLGRASLYRVLDELEERGAILKEGKNISILNREKLLAAQNN